eukprot:TRINITY_DN14358_c0_g1_i1.p1 TRINITY_DN14358_c0_g1~~TRINITY_DN14358_c0_g1_i1.p1  ORF type:complete len:575 (+),score=140.09 TRINITY_DN14358_c0_g1_i1:74-1726(+)
MGTQLGDLPDEVLSAVAGLLDLRSLLALGQTCSRHNALCRACVCASGAGALFYVRRALRRAVVATDQSTELALQDLVMFACCTSQDATIEQLAEVVDAEFRPVRAEAAGDLARRRLVDEVSSLLALSEKTRLKRTFLTPGKELTLRTCLQFVRVKALLLCGTAYAAEMLPQAYAGLAENLVYVYACASYAAGNYLRAATGFVDCFGAARWADLLQHIECQCSLSLDQLRACADWLLGDRRCLPPASAELLWRPLCLMFRGVVAWGCCAGPEVGVQLFADLSDALGLCADGSPALMVLAWILRSSRIDVCRAAGVPATGCEDAAWLCAHDAEWANLRARAANALFTAAACDYEAAARCFDFVRGAVNYARRAHRRHSDHGGAAACATDDSEELARLGVPDCERACNSGAELLCALNSLCDAVGITFVDDGGVVLDPPFARGGDLLEAMLQLCHSLSHDFAELQDHQYVWEGDDTPGGEAEALDAEACAYWRCQRLLWLVSVAWLLALVYSRCGPDGRQPVATLRKALRRASRRLCLECLTRQLQDRAALLK